MVESKKKLMIVIIIMMALALPCALAAVTIIPSSADEVLMADKKLEFGSYIVSIYHIIMFIISLISIFLIKNKRGLKICIGFSIFMFISNIVVFYFLEEYYYFMVGSLTLNIIYLVFIRIVLREMKFLEEQDPFSPYYIDKKPAE